MGDIWFSSAIEDQTLMEQGTAHRANLYLPASWLTALPWAFCRSKKYIRKMGRFFLNDLVIYSLLTMATTLHLMLFDYLVEWRAGKNKENDWHSRMAVLLNLNMMWNFPRSFKRCFFTVSTGKCVNHLWNYWHAWDRGMCSLRKYTSAPWMHQGSMLLITVQSFQELAIDHWFVLSLHPCHEVMGRIMLTSIRTATGSIHSVANG